MPSKEEYKFYKEHGICAVCRNEPVAIGRVSCPECLDKAKERSKKQWIENKEKINTRRKKCDDIHIAFGICVRCHKKEATKGQKCYECYIGQIRRDKARKHEIPREIRIELSLCYTCGQPVQEGFKTCKKHHEIFAKNIKNKNQDNRNHYWKNDNNIIFNTEKRGNINAK